MTALRMDIDRAVEIARNLHGDQKEKAVANVGLTYLF